MSDVFFEELGIPQPDYHLDIHGGQHGEMTARMMIALERLLNDLKPDAVLVYGDTNSTLAGALTAAKMFIPIAHVEAGLRSFRPMPEEINRVITDRVSRWLFCPTPEAVKNLSSEGIKSGVHFVGDVMYDTAIAMTERALKQSKILERLGIAPGKFDLASIHRAENTDTPESFSKVIRYLSEQASRFPITLPLHPRTRDAAVRFGQDLSALQVIEPVGYLDMTTLLIGCRRVLTDSGGLQKEAYFHRKLCVTLRDATEWVETIECGWNRLWQGPDYVERREIDVYGGGRASKRIAGILENEL